MATIRSEALLESVGLQEIPHLSTDELPFATSDATAGSEDELQAVVAGRPGDCDLPLTIRESRFFRNIARRGASGKAPRRTILELEAFSQRHPRSLGEQLDPLSPGAAERSRASRLPGRFQGG